MPSDATTLPLPSNSYLEAAFVRWVLTPAVRREVIQYIEAQAKVEAGGHTYLVDYEIKGEERRIAIELDGFEFHGTRPAFTYDRMRQNDLTAAGRTIARFSYDAIRLDTARCVSQLQSILSLDKRLRPLLIEKPRVETPDMDPSPLHALRPTLRSSHSGSYFDSIRGKLNLETLRTCQSEAFSALANYFLRGGKNAACVMSVGAGKTTLGVASVLAFTQRRALVVTPGSVIRGTFACAFDHRALKNSLYGLPKGPLIPGCKPPAVETLDREEGTIRSFDRARLLRADVIITNFHSLGTIEAEDGLLGKLYPEDIDFIVVDEAHIAAADSYQRLFHRFPTARVLLMSACFQRLDGRPIEADIVYRYRLIDSVADGNAKNLRVHRFAPDAEQTVYEIVWPDGSRHELRGREAILKLLGDERRLSTVTARSHEPIRQVMRAVREALNKQRELLAPVKPRVIFSALGELHAEQIASIAEDFGITCSTLHHSMTEGRIKSIRDRFEKDSGDLDGIVQLKMLGQGYDFPPITIVVPMRPYGSFGEFYQFIGRGIRVLSDPRIDGRVGADRQYLDIIYHAELGLDDHIDAIYRENDMDPQHSAMPGVTVEESEDGGQAKASVRGEAVGRPDAYVLFQPGTIEQRIVHDEARVEQRRGERELEALAQRYSDYAQATEKPVPFEQFVAIMRNLRG